jgi:2-polyprenyl-6-methoxyphenol hydroxylase-like FAD-dependent oxidoreductase
LTALAPIRLFGCVAVSRVLVCGGGVAGTVTALALAKAGIDPVVYEAHPAGADDIGAFLVA